MRLRSSIGLALAVTVFATACAQLPFKQKAVQGLQATHLALSAAQDLERQTYDAKTLPQLTAQRHADISRFFVKAFGDEQLVGQALRTWRAGDPAPASLADLQKDADDVLGLVKQLLPGGEPLLTKAQIVVDEVLKVVHSVRQ